MKLQHELAKKNDIGQFVFYETFKSGINFSFFDRSFF